MAVTTYLLQSFLAGLSDLPDVTVMISLPKVIMHEQEIASDILRYIALNIRVLLCKMFIYTFFSLLFLRWLVIAKRNSHSWL